MESLKKNKVQTDATLMIATGHSRKAVKWKNQEITWSEMVEKLSTTTRTRETANEYKLMPKSQRDEIKDVGGFVGGVLKEGRRKIENLANRSLITLDLDDVNTSVEDVWSSITLTYGVELCIYTTHSHMKDSPRLRLIIPINRRVYADEYQAISRRIAADIGIDLFDDTTYEPSRLMYWPSTSADGEYIFKHQKGNLLNADEVLDRYLDWKDVSLWPVSSRQSEVIKREIKKQEDPFEKKGVIGAFCRSYTIDEVIEEYLSDYYEPTKMDGRYTYKEGSTVGGLVVYDDKFAFSHHGTDPSSGLLCNAFDLVRIHLYGDLDSNVRADTPITKYKSYEKMLEAAVQDDKVKINLDHAKSQEVNDDFIFLEEEEEPLWKRDLEVNTKGQNLQTINNAVVVLENDSNVKDKLVYDEFANRAMVVGNVPWSRLGDHDWSDTDDSGMRYFMESRYGLTTAYKIDDAKNLVFDRHKFHPVRDYLKELEWDGVDRIDSLLIDYLGAEDNIYTRLVTRTHLVGAVARVMRPGVKFDTMVTLAGPQGVGKSTFIYKISNGWYSASLDTMKGKEAAELIQGNWHIELEELNATKKSDRDQVKGFLSKQYDVYRVAYAKNTSRFPRQCVFWGTTNETNFLRDPTGDRRTYPIVCHFQDPIKDIWKDLDDEIDQIWAEAYYRFTKNEPIYLKGEALEIAKEKQAEHREDTPLSGLVLDYLDRDYPANWEDMSLTERRSFINGEQDTFVDAPLTYKKDRVCVLEVWCELLGKRPGDLKPINSRELNDILRGLPNWYPAKSNLSFGNIYGKQRGYLRDEF